MKKITLTFKNLSWILSAMLILGVASCRKYNSLGYTPGTGAPVITSVSTLSRTVNDTVVTSVTTISSTGVITTTLDTNTKHQTTTPLDSTTATGNKQQYYVIHGSNLGSVTSISFNGVSAYFNRAYGTDQSLIVSIPLAVPTTGSAATNKITLVSQYGKTSYSFTTITPAPTVTAVSTNDFQAGTDITLSGVGFATVTSVGLTGTTATATIVSQTDAQMEIQMPATTVNTTNLVFSYASAGKTSTVTSSLLFEDLDQAYQFFTDNYGPGWFSNSWGPTSISTTVSKTGTSSFAATYPKGNYWANGFGNNTGITQTAATAAGYKYFSMWIKGGIESYTLYFTSNTRGGGFGNSDQSMPLIVPAGVWTYYKIPLTTLNLWSNGSALTQFGLWIAGPADQDETFYYDDVVLLKE